MVSLHLLFLCLCSLPLSSSLPPAGSLGFVAAAADPVAAPVVPVAAPAAPASLFRPLDVASAPRGIALLLSGSSFIPVCSAPLPLGSASTQLLSASAPHGSAHSLGSTSIPLAPHPSDAPRGAPFRLFMLGPSASVGPSHSSFTFTADDTFDPGLADPSAPEPEVPIPPSVPDSVHAEIRRMYAYLVDLFL